MKLVREVTQEVLCVITKIRGQVGLTIIKTVQITCKSGLGSPHIGP